MLHDLGLSHRKKKGMTTMAKQQKYWIKLLNHNDGYLYQWTSRDGITSTYIGNSWHEDTDTTGRTKQKFTKEEVLALDERYWQFAIPVK